MSPSERQQGRAIQRLADDEEVGEIVDGVDQRDEIAALRHGDETGAPVLGLRHQPEAHLGDDAEIALGEQAGGSGP